MLAVAVSGRGVVDSEQPVLHVDDEGFLRGRAAFETTRVYGGRPFRLDAHLERLAQSAARLSLPAVDRGLFHELTSEALASAGVPDCSVRHYFTPGREGRGEPLLLVLVQALPPDLEETRADGIRLVSCPIGLDVVGSWPLGGIKSTSYAVNMMAGDEAKRRGGDDAVLLAHGSIVLECPTANIWWRRGSTLYTPSLDLGVLAGVTRAVCLEVLPELDYQVVEGAFSLDELAGADEAFTTSSVREVMPAVALDGKPIGSGAPGPAAGGMQRELRRLAGSPV